ncbi:hypothetical protein EH32_01665 [Erythrobacter litoralis]|uniref:Uncharacterized protein n=1 Tax=Erythrobacter litoralis TaxID=39960 RepID=A0A074ME55_9SPHN|nr:hypothetical protein EH32_01665 [Erythrobacter litoralis]
MGTTIRTIAVFYLGLRVFIPSARVLIPRGQDIRGGYEKRRSQDRRVGAAFRRDGGWHAAVGEPRARDRSRAVDRAGRRHPHPCRARP